MMKALKILFITLVLLAGCSKEKASNRPAPVKEKDDPKITSPEYADQLLFVDKNNYQILTMFHLLTGRGLI